MFGTKRYYSDGVDGPCELKKRQLDQKKQKYLMWRSVQSTEKFETPCRLKDDVPSMYMKTHKRNKLLMKV